MLEPLGLTCAEQELYELLVSSRPQTEAEAGNPDAAQRLVELGLITLAPTDPPRYVVLPPETALELLAKDREQELARARQQMISLSVQFHTSQAREEPAALVEVLHGDEEITRGMNRLLRSARQEVSAWDAPPYLHNPNQVNQLELDELQRGISYRVLYDRRQSVDRPGRLAALLQGINDGEQARVGDVPMKLVLSDTPMAFVPFDIRATRHATALLVHDPALVAGLYALFELYWDRAVPLATYVGRRASADRPTEQERELLALLLSGFTDSEMAAHLGWNERTVRSRIDRMRQRLEADTRFQAGYQAVQRGWLEHREQ